MSLSGKSRLWRNSLIVRSEGHGPLATVVSDTSPLRYLSILGRANLVEHIFGHVLIPRVEQELTYPSAPEAVRQWMVQPPDWLEIRDLPQAPGPELTARLDRGEAEAIQLAINLRAGVLPIDERRGRQMARARGLTVIGALGILLESYRRELIPDRLEILAQLHHAGFRASRRLVHGFEEQVRLIRSKASNHASGESSP